MKTEGERFELSVGCPTQTFQVCALDRYANPPIYFRIMAEKDQKIKPFVFTNNKGLYSHFQ